MKKSYEPRSFQKIYTTEELEKNPVICTEFAADLKRDGIVCIKISELDISTAIAEVWKTLITQQPWDDEHQIKLYSKKKENHILDPMCDNDMEEILDIITKPLDTKTRNYFKKRWVLHRTFGRECSGISFWQHTRCEITENKGLYAAMTTALGTLEICADLNGTITRLPGEGEEAFLHWDTDPRTIGKDTKKLICGKVCFTSANFICVPGTHTSEFLNDFVAEYGPHYSHIKLGANKFGLRQGKPDPFNLWGRQCCFRVPEGHVVFWDENLLHGHYKLDVRTHVQWGCFLGYSVACNSTQREERKRLYETGEPPKAHPSGDRVHFYPKKYQNFPKVFKSQILDRMHPKLYDKFIYVRKNSKGVDTYDTRPWGWSEDNPYVKYKFSPLGKRIMGIEAYDTLQENL